MLHTLIVVRNMALLRLTISWFTMSRCMTTPEAIQTFNMAKQVERIDCVSLPVEVPLDVPELVHLVALQGSDLDPKCDT